MYRVHVARKAEKSLVNLAPQQKRRIYAAIAALKNDPYGGKKLEGEYKNYYSLRIWPYRIIYEVKKDKKLIFIIAVGHRQGVYK